jgi:hypothetical protein
MQGAAVTVDRRTQSAVRRLLVAVDRSVEAAREVEKARAALDRVSERPLRLFDRRQLET